MRQFAYHLPTKIIFGQRAAEALLAELATRAAQKVLLVSDQGLAQIGLVQQLKEALVEGGVETFTFLGVSSNPTTDEVAGGLEIAHQQNVAAIVALGGGSPIDVGKGIAMLLANGGAYADYQWGGKTINKRSWPLLAVPTTAGTGSEVSKVAVISDPANPFKKGVLSPRMFPHAAVIDPTLTLGLPAHLTAATGMDAFIHALEAYTGLRANPYTDRMALAAMETIWAYLPKAVVDGSDLQAREMMMLAALWGGTAMDHAGLGLVHALSGPLTTHLHLHHGMANALILPHVLRFNLPQIQPAKLAVLKNTFGLSDNVEDDLLVDAVAQFVAQLDLPGTLTSLGAKLDVDLQKTIAEETTQMVLILNNPRKASAADCNALLEGMK